MSVILFTPEEIARTYRDYEAILPAITSYAPTKEKLALALTAFHYSNVTAYCLTYSDWQDTDAGRFHDLAPVFEQAPLCWLSGPRVMRRVVRQIRSFLYNAISNAGTQCLPSPYLETLEAAASCIANHLAGIYSHEDEDAA